MTEAEIEQGLRLLGQNADLMIFLVQLARHAQDLDTDDQAPGENDTLN